MTKNSQEGESPNQADDREKRKRQNCFSWIDKIKEGRGIVSFSEDNDWTDRSLVGGGMERIVMLKYRGYRKVKCRGTGDDATYFRKRNYKSWE